MTLPDYLAVRKASVWKAGQLAGSLDRQGDGTISFSYLPDYAGDPVATSLPLGAEPVRTAGGALPPFFAGLLPEGRRLSALRAAVKTSLDDELSLLLAVGEDAIGDVQVLPSADAAGPGTASAGPTLELAPHEVSFAELFERAVGSGLEDRAALPGVQDKISGRMITLPVADRDAAWILKLNPPEFPSLVQNEAFFLKAARDSGLDVAEARLIHDRDEQPGLLVRRFDRVALPDGSFQRVAQEDACQVLGRYPADKYRMSSEDVMRALARPTSAPVVAARALLQQLAFAYLSCNGDAHGKNFSILKVRGEWRVSPAYDLPSSYPYGDLTMALPIGRKRREDIGRADFLELGAACGVPGKACERVLDRLLKAAPNWIDRLEELPFSLQIQRKLARACRYRADRLA
ncbi:Serine/threonine-protein kinase HipA [Planctomycetes bacterium Poly30]|uniref:Serine/threonine-protein kinase HipA n=1 Tax=Saltatorellus ferox TaxID=2528018 RepID=A0A518EZX9_9BACT|nr:Serine/threonine-protein kinase HipA [Planctomycetes bacterium Poly30]